MANPAEIDQALLVELLKLLEPQDADTRLRLLNTAAAWFDMRLVLVVKREVPR